VKTSGARKVLLGKGVKDLEGLERRRGRIGERGKKFLKEGGKDDEGEDRYISANHVVGARSL
jgi:hypothetical protein